MEGHATAPATLVFGAGDTAIRVAMSAQVLGFLRDRAPLSLAAPRGEELVRRREPRALTHASAGTRASERKASQEDTLLLGVGFSPMTGAPLVASDLGSLDLPEN